MRAMILSRAGAALQLLDGVDVGEPQPGEVVIRVHACGVCRTDLHIADGELDGPKQPLILGHEIVGTVCAVGSGVIALKPGDRVGIPWLGWTCGACD
jgi:alcohol dehydrogenase, propanol-preferring